MNEIAVVIQKSEIREVFVADDGLDPILRKIAEEARAQVSDAGTAKGRDEIRSLAYKVAQSKTYLDGLGKDLVSEMKEEPKKVDDHRRKMRDFLDALKDEVRAPLTQWEEAEERKKAEVAAAAAAAAEKERADAEARALAEKIEADHELALFMDAEHNRAKQAEKERAEKAEADRIEQIKADALRKAAEESAKREADLAAEVARQAQMVADAELATRLAQERAKDAAAKAEKDAAEAVERADREKAAAVEAEKARVRREKDAEAAAAAKREADKAHKGRINRAAADALMASGLSEDQAKSVVKAIATGYVPAVSIHY